jgi:hypothetical protein
MISVTEKIDGSAILPLVRAVSNGALAGSFACAGFAAVGAKHVRARSWRQTEARMALKCSSGHIFLYWPPQALLTYTFEVIGGALYM